MGKNLASLFVVFLSLLVSIAQAASLVEVGFETVVNLGSSLEYIEDTDNKLSFEDIRSTSDSNWVRNESDIPNFGYSDSAYWFRVRLKNSELEPKESLLSIQYPLLDHIELFQVDSEDGITSEVTGDEYPFQQRPLRHRDFLFPLTLYYDNPVDIYIKVKTQGSTQVPVSLWDAKQFSLEDQDEQFLKAMYYGMLLVLVAYNLFLFVAIRERPYIYYVGLVFSILVLMAGAHGYLYQYLYPNSPRVHELSMLLSVPSTMFFASLFSIFFLNLSQTAPRINKLMSSVSLLFFLCLLGAFFLPYSISTRIYVFLAIPGSLLILFVGPYAWYKGQKSARYFTIAWAFLLIGIFISALNKFGFLPRNGFTEHALNWGSAFEAILLSFALADRFNRERDARYKAQKERLIEAEQRKDAEDKLYYQATHQSVDGLPNLVMLQQSLHKLLHSDQDKQQSFSLVFIQLRGFQEINKTLGHANADIILSLFSSRLKSLKLNYDLYVPIEQLDDDTHYFAHIEGVVFAFMVRGHDSGAAKGQAEEIRKRIGGAIEFNGMELDLGFTVGIAQYPEHGHDIATLIRHTWVAVDSGGNSNDHIAAYAREINPYSARRLALMGELRKAISENALELYYQPIISCDENQLIGAEALLRWNHPKLGFIPPDEFILLAEKTGIMRSLTMWVLENAIVNYRHWEPQFNPKLISVNISAVNLQEQDFATNVRALIDQYQFNAENLVFEITETAVMSDPDMALSSLKQLSDLGVKVAIDDFGTGHSSLSYIRKLPVYEIKIDRSFVSEMIQVEGDQVIVKTTLNMSHDLGYKVVAEGVEDQEVLNTLRELGCDYVQGYHIAKPMPASAYGEWVRAHNAGDGTSSSSAL